MQRHLIRLIVVALCLTPAVAQTPTTFVTGATLYAAQLNAAFGTKANVTAGTLISPTITGGTQNGLPLANIPTTPGLLTSTGGSTVTSTPIGTAAGTVAAGNDSRITGAAAAANGTLTNPTITGGTVSSSTSLFGLNPSTVANLESRLTADGFSTGSGGSSGVTQAAPTTFSPVIADGGSGTFVYLSGHQTATYVKTGRQVTFNIDVEWTTNDGGTTAVTVTGLPAALASGSGPIIGFAYGVTLTSAVLYGVVQTSGALAFYAGGSTGTDPAVLGSALGGTAGIRITGSYISAS